jgi:hypothetical protein
LVLVEEASTEVFLVFLGWEVALTPICVFYLLLGGLASRVHVVAFTVLGAPL